MTRKSALNIVPCLMLGLAMTLSAQSHAQIDEDAAAEALENADGDGDGMVSQDEFRTSRMENFARLDRNEDGFVDAEDAGRGLAGRRISRVLPQLMERLDTDGDARLSPAEFIDAPMQRFAAMDLNGDGLLEPDELAMMAERRTDAAAETESESE